MNNDEYIQFPFVRDCVKTLSDVNTTSREHIFVDEAVSQLGNYPVLLCGSLHIVRNGHRLVESRRCFARFPIKKLSLKMSF